MKSAVLALCLASASALIAPAAPKASTQLHAVDTELGVLPPLGFFDPLNLAASGTQEDFERRRITELKHGRVAMAAFVGYLVPEVYKFPGYLSKHDGIKFEDVPNGLNALTVVPGLGWFQMIMVVGWLEAGPFAASQSGFAGDFGWPYFGRQIQDPAEKASKLNMELQNGRAMFGIMGLLMQGAPTAGLHRPLRRVSAAPPAAPSPARVSDA
ncbi:chlorophyll A-B binding protein [Aureococcus anophagefferens]|nr:chlorophyll A-B binding protein [Aureococcus anophagefferens]